MANNETELEDGIATPASRTKEPSKTDSSKSRVSELSDLLADGLVIEDKYQIISVIGTGATGTVYRARHLMLDMPIALKVLHRNTRDIAKGMELFRREVTTATSLRHQGIVTVIGTGVLIDGRPYIAMDFFEGTTLDTFIAQRGKLNLSEFFAVFLGLTSALKHAHAQGIVHRDVKPGNIMVAQSTNQTIELVKLVDFGLAKFVQTPGQDQKETQTAAILGTSGYMSPEQCAGGHVDQRSDIYSLGCVMYESLTGKPIFSGASTYEVMYKHLHDSLSKLSGKFALPAPLARVINCCLKKAPADRYQNIEELESDLVSLQEQQEQLRPRTFWNSAPLLVALSATLVVLVFVAFKMMQKPAQTPIPQKVQASVWSSYTPSTCAQVVDRIRMLALDHKLDQAILTAETWLHKKPQSEGDIIEVQLQLARELQKQALANNTVDEKHAEQSTHYVEAALKHIKPGTLAEVHAKHIAATVKEALHKNDAVSISDYVHILNQSSKLPESFQRTTIERDLAKRLYELCDRQGRLKDAEKYARLALLDAFKLTTRPTDFRSVTDGINLASVLWKLERRKESLQVTMDMIENVPASAVGERMRFATWLAEREQFDASLRLLDDMEAGPKASHTNASVFRTSNSLRASILERTHRADQAMAAYRMILDEDNRSGNTESLAHLSTQFELARCGQSHQMLQQASSAAIECLESFDKLKRPWTIGDYALFSTLLELMSTKLAVDYAQTRQYLMEALPGQNQKDWQRNGLKTFWLAELHFRLQNYTEARRLVGVAVAAFEKRSWLSAKLGSRALALMRLADMEALAGETESAERLYRLASEAALPAFRGNYLRCMVPRICMALAAREYAKAETMVNETLEVGDVNPESKVQLLILQSQVYRESGDNDPEKPLLQALQLVEHLPATMGAKMAVARVHTSYGMLLLRKQDPRSTKYLEQGVTKWQGIDLSSSDNDQLAQAYFELGLSEERTAKDKALAHIDLAIKTARKKLRDNPAAAEYLLAKAMMYKRAGLWQDAEDTAKQALKSINNLPIRPDLKASICLELALIQRQVKNFAKALESVQRGLEYLSPLSKPSFVCRMEKADLIAAKAQIQAEKGEKSLAGPLYTQAEVAYAALGPSARVNLAGCLQEHLKWVPQSSAEATAIRKQLRAL